MPTTVGTTRLCPPPWVLRGIAHHRGYYAALPTTVGTTRLCPPPWVLRGIAHHHGYYAASPTSVGTTRHRSPPRVRTRPPPWIRTTAASPRGHCGYAARIRPERSVVHARSICDTGKKTKKNGRPSHPLFMGSGVCLWLGSKFLSPRWVFF